MIEEKIRQLYQIIDDLEAAYPEKHFTLDGILIGNLGEVYAAEKYGLKLLPEATKTHDAVTADGKYVQIRVTQADSAEQMSCVREFPQRHDCARMTLFRQEL